MGEPNQISRDLDKYLNDYEDLPYESIQESFRREIIVKLIKEINPTNLIEVGCGRTSVFSELPNTIGSTIVEPISELLSLNKLKLAANRNLFFYNGTLSDYALLAPTEHDACLISSLLHEVNDQKGLLKDCRNVLGSSGKLIINVPNSNSIHRILGVEKGILINKFSLSDTQKKMQQKNEPFSISSLTNLVETNGFSVDFVWSAIPKLLSHIQLHELLSEQIVTLSFLEQLNKLSQHLDPFGSEIFMVASPIAQEQ